jgi:hypothetical protein
MQLHLVLRIIYLLLGLFFSISSILIYQFVAKPLFPEEVTEVDKKIYFDYVVNRALEYDSEQKPFWWLEMGENSLQLLNVGDETIIGNVSFKLTPNPCNFSRSIKFMFNDKYDLKFIPGLQEEFSYNLEIKLEPFQSKELKIVSTRGEECKVSNGDERNFLLKLSEVRFN